MTLSNRLRSPHLMRGVLLSVGVGFVVVGLAWAPLELARDTPPVTSLLLASFVVVPGLVLLNGASKLSEADISPEFYGTVLSRCVAGFGVMVGVIVLYHLRPAGGSSTPMRATLILGAFGSVAGYRIGLHQARATELERTKEALDETVEQLRTSNELLDQFAYAASHDLQEPLRMVTSHLMLLKRRHGDDLDEEGKEYLEYAIERAGGMREMIDSLLEYSRIETGNGELEPVELDDVMDAVLDDLRLQIKERDATVDVESLPQVRGDTGQLQQLFQNLLGNALKYSGDAPPTVEISAERNGQGWNVSVKDEGIGIEPEETDRIFDVFERGYAHDSENGTGMGLTLCKRIAERHGGDIHVDSTPGEGSTFSVTLPDAEVTADE